MFSKIEKMKYLKLFCLITLVFSLLLTPNLIFAAPEDTSTEGGTNRLDTGLKEAAEIAGIPQRGEESIPARIGSIISYALGFVGVVFLILMIAGGLMWMTAAGNEERVSKAKSLITNAVIGMIIVFSAYAITYFVTETLLGD
jgi:hypothetical protein